MVKTIPMKLILVEKGHIIYEVTSNEKHTNLQGEIHGGFCATILDSVTGGVARTLMDKGVKFLMTDLNIKMIHPMQLDQSYQGISKVINTGTRLVMTKGVIIDENQKIYAHGTATFMILKK